MDTFGKFFHRHTRTPLNKTLSLLKQGNYGNKVFLFKNSGISSWLRRLIIAGQGNLLWIAEFHLQGLYIYIYSTGFSANVRRWVTFCLLPNGSNSLFLQYILTDKGIRTIFNRVPSPAHVTISLTDMFEFFTDYWFAYSMPYNNNWTYLSHTMIKTQPE